AIERSGLHRRLALSTLHTLGGSPRRLVWGFLVVTAALSMWLSNTATTLMLLPIALAVSNRIEDAKTPVRMLLAVAFGASIGGMGTLVGTPPNLVLAGMAPNLVPNLPSITFGGWMLFGLPIVAVMLPVAGLLLGRGLPRKRIPLEALDEERRALGAWTTAEKRAAVLFALTAVAWITRSGMTVGTFHVPGWSHLLTTPRLVSDAVPAIAAAILACLVPAGTGDKRPLVTWSEVRHGVPWGILLLFGGGFAIADAFHASGLDTWMAGELQGLGSLPLPLVILSVVLLTAFVTNLTSNTATATLLMPVMAALAEAIHEPPYVLMASAAVAASLAFVLPVATPPNAIIMGSGKVKASDLFKEGIRLNLIAVVLITILCLALGPLVLPV
ncbi:MAG: DASS family sodium-coupled anion symporter, partial [Deltaproteobacteria bacterium]|nr:DASS family sodium-coupled anion symporter [Deltaproteobacteria bacterium]